MLPLQKIRRFLLSFAIFAFECLYLYLNAIICKHKYAKNFKAWFTLPPYRNDQEYTLARHSLVVFVFTWIANIFKMLHLFADNNRMCKLISKRAIKIVVEQWAKGAMTQFPPVTQT